MPHLGGVPMNLAHKLLNNPGLIALTVVDEQKEIAAVNGFTMPNHNPECKHKHLLLRFAHMQRGYGHIKPVLMFHVMNPGNHFETTLSMDGVRRWKLI